MRHNRFWFGMLVFGLLAALNCRVSSAVRLPFLTTPTPTPTLTPSPTATPTPTPTSTPTPTPTLTPTPLPYGGVLRIGHMLPLSGPYPDFAEASRDAAKLWLRMRERRLNLAGVEYRLQAIFVDTALDPNQSLVAARELLQKDVLAVIGPYGSLPALETARWLNAREIPTLVVWTTYPRITQGKPYVFRINPDDDLYAQAWLLLVEEFGAAHLGILIEEEEPFSREFGERLARWAELWGFQVTTAFFLDTDPGSRANALRQVRETDALLWPLFVDQMWDLLPLVDILNITQPVVGPDVWDNPDLLGCTVCTNFYFVTPWLPIPAVTEALVDTRASEFVEMYAQALERWPGQLEALTWDAYEVLAQALEVCAPLTGDLTQDRGCLRDALAQGTWQTLTGPMRFDRDGDALRCVLVITWDEVGDWQLYKRLCLEE